MVRLLVASTGVRWSSPKPERRYLKARAYLDRPGSPQPDMHGVRLDYRLGDQPAQVTDLSRSGALAATERTELEVLLEAGRVPARELLSGFFEGKLTRGRLPNTPLLVTHLDFNIRPFSGDQLIGDQWIPGPLSKHNMPLRAGLYNQPGAPVSWFILRWDSAGKLAGVRYESGNHQKGAPTNPLSAMAQYEMDATTTHRYFGLRYPPKVAAELIADIDFLGYEGRRLGLELLAGLA